jgi:hypothetical protein
MTKPLVETSRAGTMFWLWRQSLRINIYLNTTRTPNLFIKMSSTSNVNLYAKSFLFHDCIFNVQSGKSILYTLHATLVYHNTAWRWNIIFIYWQEHLIVHVWDMENIGGYSTCGAGLLISMKPRSQHSVKQSEAVEIWSHFLVSAAMLVSHCVSPRASRMRWVGRETHQCAVYFAGRWLRDAFPQAAN